MASPSEAMDRADAAAKAEAINGPSLWRVCDAAGLHHNIKAIRVVRDDKVLTFYRGADVVAVFVAPASAVQAGAGE